jgi:hypothetical protein
MRNTSSLSFAVLCPDIVGALLDSNVESLATVWLVSDFVVGANCPSPVVGGCWAWCKLAVHRATKTAFAASDLAGCDAAVDPLGLICSAGSAGSEVKLLARNLEAELECLAFFHWGGEGGGAEMVLVLISWHSNKVLTQRPRP